MTTSTIPTYNIGIDIGSTTLKLVVIDDHCDIVFSDYRRHNTDIPEALKAAYQKMYDSVGNCNMRVKFTGSVGMGYAERFGAPFVQEVVASAKLIETKYSHVRTFIDIGGEDSKMIFFEDGKSPDIRMNGSCAGGTGAFIDQTATLLGVNTIDLDELAQTSQTLYPIASRCGVFSKTDIQNLISRKVSKNDIAASVFNAVAVQVIASLARGTDIVPQIFFCGGPFAFLPQLKKAFMRQLSLTDDDCILSAHAQLIPAWGTAIMPVEGEQKTVMLSHCIEQLNSTNDDDFKNIVEGRLPALFESNDELERWKKKKDNHFVETIDWKDLKDTRCYLGVDSGSTTTKIVLIDQKKRVVYKDYLRNEGDSFNAFLKGLTRMKEAADAHNVKVLIAGSTTTGYGENLIKTAFNLHNGIIETMAHYLAAHGILPQVSFILDIGGQDMKAIFVENGTIKRLEINEACSSGCGSFIENFANMLNYPVAEFARMACFAKQP
ncbi:MAG: 2-hydroxyglutaryl-CoA dehydratase, partial [Bacteroidales bacterium]|nr:2-hydroxyglutaryl-CoA dehydratase [Bacteroidales bacterium]